MKMQRPVGAPPGLLVYLDWNVMVDLRSGEFQDLEILLDDLKKTGLIWVPYSATHVEELQGFHRSSGSSELGEIVDRLNWLRDFTDGKYLYTGVDVKIPELRQADPACVLKTINEVPWARSTMQGLATLMNASHVAEFRKDVGFDPIELNNLKPPGVLEQIDDLLRAGLQKHFHSGMPFISIREMIQLAISYHRDGAQFGWSHQVAGIMVLLNWIGLWADHDFTGERWESSFADGEHVALAGHTDLFVTRDKRLRIKALAVYEYSGVSTQVLTPEEAGEWLRRER
ncbi:MAG: hypothetical protein L0191_19350 [Acidobacteria bacterium]|nr:hypothetical protein [Acidobacteriota bacterium]